MARPYVYAQQQPTLRHQWEAMHITRKRAEITATARRLVAAKSNPRVIEVEARTGAPWYLILIIFEREAGGPPHWDKNIAQGDDFNTRSHHEPIGRGPFRSFADAAYDALVTLKHYDKLRGQWSIERILYTLQPYNGLGYFYKGIPSPYVWSCSDQYDPPNGPGGKYVADHVFKSSEVDQQIGCAPLLKAMMELDPSIQPAFDGGPSTPPGPIEPMPDDHLDPDVVWLQKALNQLGEALKVDGVYGRGTLEAVRRFQAAHGLNPDGISGPMTEVALRSAVGQKPPVQPKPPVKPPVKPPIEAPRKYAAGVGIAAALSTLAAWWGAHPGVTVAIFVGAIALFAFIMSKQQ